MHGAFAAMRLSFSCSQLFNCSSIQTSYNHDDVLTQVGTDCVWFRGVFYLSSSESNFLPRE
jgi:hypothetical protein